MIEDSESPEADGILALTIPWDVAARNQRQRILEGMARCCAGKTYTRTTIADIVASAGISRATFYKHFEHKKECFLAVVDDFLVELQNAVAISPNGIEDSKTRRIREVIAVLLERLAADPARTTLLLVEAPNVDANIVLGYRQLTTEALEAELRAMGHSGNVGADPALAFGRAKVLLTSYVTTNRIESLPSLLPELIYIALLPYLGQEMALEQAQLAQ